MFFNGYRYTVYILNRYFNYQWIFFTKTKDKIFKKFIEFIIYIKNQTSSLKIQVIYLDNNIKFYLVQLKTFTTSKKIRIKTIIFSIFN